ncbi:MAG: electron transfer flavoprotein subunit alpha/FixB family protein [Proteobacteria bacterium]|nr:electron transfer flavoprotein subunit alpha/FixB family protein [Pseudomonadota bacterium]
MENRDILIIGEHLDGKLKPSTLELVTLGQRMAEQGTRTLGLVLIGDHLDGVCEDAARQTGLDILYLRVPGCDYYNGDIYKTLIQAQAVAWNVSHVITAHSSQGTDYAPGLAVRLYAACITGVNGLEQTENGEPLFSRAICGGNFNTLIRSQSRCTVLTVQPGYFPARDHVDKPGQVSTETHECVSETTQVMGMEKARAAASALGQARIIVSAGRGIGSEENLDVVRRFAALFPGSALGGSRPLIDMGWLEYKHQVGITGAVVSPDVYIACGISGSSQHIAGMNTSGYVIAINTDPHAAIFNVSDLCIVDDLVGFMEAFETLVET